MVIATSTMLSNIQQHLPSRGVIVRTTAQIRRNWTASEHCRRKLLAMARQLQLFQFAETA